MKILNLKILNLKTSNRSERKTAGSRAILAALIFAFFIFAPLSGPAWPVEEIFPRSASALRSPYDRAVGRALENFSDISKSGEGAFAGGIVPHHDLALDMIVRFYAKLSVSSGRRNVSRVWLFAPDHFRRAKRFVAVCPSDWKLTSGVLSADGAAVEALRSMKIVEARSDLFAPEHGITLHIPLIARFFPGATVVPIVLRPDIPDLALLRLEKEIRGLAGGGDLVILSMDLSHYNPPEAMALEDERTLSALTEMRPRATGAIDVDARRAAALVLMLFRDMGAEKGELLEHTDSSALLGRRVESGTSYATILYRLNK
ncbi:MAG: AmmeMemoRadiSam system protein B [Synergistaceae bacterium]|jgi:AmmeMemoRadiSam system protein B|nr:AmmeMemoRadiSam system protein B [Synergistaceae bacterium]